MTLNLTGKVSLVTGSSRGLGLSIARQLAQYGSDIVMCGRSEQSLLKAKEELSKMYSSVRIESLQTDVSLESDVIRLFDFIDKTWSRLDICVNNAAMLKLTDFIDYDLALWNAMVSANLTSAFLCSHAAFKLMSRDSVSKKSIVNIGSLSGIRGVEKFAGMSAYIACKHALVGLTESLAVEGKPNGIHVNCVAPGSIKTDMFQSNFPDFEPGSTPDDIAKNVLLFCDVNNTALTSGSIFEIFCNA